MAVSLGVALLGFVRGTPAHCRLVGSIFLWEMLFWLREEEMSHQELTQRLSTVITHVGKCLQVTSCLTGDTCIEHEHPSYYMGDVDAAVVARVYHRVLCIVLYVLEGSMMNVLQY